MNPLTLRELLGLAFQQGRRSAQLDDLWNGTPLNYGGVFRMVVRQAMDGEPIHDQFASDAGLVELHAKVRSFASRVADLVEVGGE